MEYDKGLTADAFYEVYILETLECIIFIATNAYDIAIDNPDIKLVIPWDIPISFDDIIQCIGKVKQKGEKTIFIFLTPKLRDIEDPKKIEK